MRKVLVVDDEFLVRVGIKSFLNWEENGYTIIGEAADGKQALEIMAEALQSTPADALGQAWGVTITPGHVAKYQ